MTDTPGKNPLENRIVFMGTPEFAVPSLRAIIDAGYPVAGVVTAPDRPAGRGKKIRASAVKQFAEERGLKILQPEKLRDPSFTEELKALRPDIQVVVAFRMLPEVVWRIPPKGTFNLHASLLPLYRGAAPINHVLINGETRTGLTTFLIDEKIDTGEILLREETFIGEEENAGELHDRLKVLGAGLVLRTVELLATGRAVSTPQSDLPSGEGSLPSAPKIRREDCRIDWNRNGVEVSNLIRGLSPSPGAFSFMEDEEGNLTLCKIFASDFSPMEHRESPGTLHTDGKTFLKVAVRDGFLSIEDLQMEGKKRLPVREFLLGFNPVTSPRRFS